MKLTRIALATMATMATVSMLGTPSVVQAASIDDFSTQLNGKVITISGNSQDEIKDKLKKYGINLDNIDLQKCPGFSSVVIPGTEIEVPEVEKPEVEVPEVEAPEVEKPEVEVPDVEKPGQSEEENGNSGTETELSYAEQVVKLVNEERAKYGLSPLTIDKSVESAALVRSKEIEKSFSHTRPNGSSFSTVLKEQGVNFMGAGENIAWGQKSPEEVMQGWMNSEGHRANILNAKFTKIGVGYYQNSNGTNYWTQLFTY